MRLSKEYTDFRGGRADSLELVVGTFAGALVGGVLGSQVGKTVGAALLDGVSAFAESLSNQRPGDPPDNSGA